MATFAVGDHVVVRSQGHLLDGEGGVVTRMGHAHPMLPGQVVVAIKLDRDRAYSVGDWVVNVSHIRKEGDMPEKAKSVSGPLVEDTQVVGGTDKATGAPAIRPKTPEGKADKLMEATDPRERA